MSEPASNMVTAPQLIATSPELVQPARLMLSAEPRTIGRGPSCDVIVRHRQVSRMHARVTLEGGRYMLTDTGSVNGTFVNGIRLVAPHPLVDGDLIGLGGLAPVLSFADPDSTMPGERSLGYDDRTMSFVAGGARIELTPLQMRLLRFLYERAGSLCTREECAAAIWGRDYEPGRDAGAFDQALNSLRRALRDHGLEGDLIETRRGQGYILRI